MWKSVGGGKRRLQGEVSYREQGSKRKGRRRRDLWKKTTSWRKYCVQILI